MEYCLKGFLGGVVKEVIKHPVATLVTVGVGAALTVATGGAALPVLTAVGAVASAGTIGYGAYQVVAAETDAEAKQACETIGTGIFGLATAALSSKAALDKAAKAGVVSARRASDAGYTESLVQCFKATPEAVKVSGQYLSEAIGAVASSVKLEASKLKLTNLSAAERFELEKTVIRNNVKNNIRKSTNLSIESSKYKDPALQAELINSINEDNIDLAKTLIYNHGGDDALTSNYNILREEYSRYILKSVPKVLKSTDPKVHEAAQYIIDCEEIVDKFHAIRILNSSNAQEIMNLRPMSINGSNYSIQELIWEKYPIKIQPQKMLRYFASNEGALSNKGKNMFRIRIYGDKGKIPNIPGAYPEINPVTKQPDFNHYVIYEETSENGYFWQAMDKARALIDKYGYKD